jgi:hypothetical protein
VLSVGAEIASFLAGLAFTTGGLTASILTFIVASIAIVVLMFSLSFAIGRAQEGIVEKLKLNSPTVKRWGAYILMGVGVWLIILTIFADFFATIYPV